MVPNPFARRMFIFSFLACLLGACKKEDTGIDKNIPESVAQLMDNTRCDCDPRISLFKWKDQLLYVPYTTHPACDMIPRFYDQEGNIVELSNDEQNQFWNEKELVRTVWECGR